MTAMLERLPDVSLTIYDDQTMNPAYEDLRDEYTANMPAETLAMARHDFLAYVMPLELRLRRELWHALVEKRVTGAQYVGRTEGVSFLPQTPTGLCGCIVGTVNIARFQDEYANFDSFYYAARDNADVEGRPESPMELFASPIVPEAPDRSPESALSADRRLALIAWMEELDPLLKAEPV